MIDRNDHRTRQGQRRRGMAAPPTGTRAKIAGRVACGHEVKVGDRIVHRGNGWLCESCAQVTTTSRRPR